LTEGWQRQRFFEALARALLSACQPLLLLLDDLQRQHVIILLTLLMLTAPTEKVATPTSCLSLPVDGLVASG
jgi:hypothetical protein